MGEVLFVLAAVAAGQVLTAILRYPAQKRVRIWMAVARKIGLREVKLERSLLGDSGVTARDAGHRRVRIDFHSPNREHAFTRVSIAGNSGVTLQREIPLSALDRTLVGRGREIEMGDQDFDDEIWVRGEPVMVRALLDAETRLVVRRMIDGFIPGPGPRGVAVRTVTLVDGELRALVDETRGPLFERNLGEAITALLELAARFERPSDPVARLAANLQQEPEARVRLQGIELLALSYPTHAATRPALRRALADPEPAVRLQAAATLDGEGHETLLALAAADVDDGTRAHAIDLLGRQMPPAVATSALRQALRDRHLETADACIHALAHVGAGAESSELLAKVLAREGSRLALGAAEALGSGRFAGAEEALLGALGRDEPELRLRAVEALGHVGSARSVLPLHEAGAGVTDLALRRAARQSVAKIQSRLAGATPGQLSLAEDGGGQLSLAEDGAGRLSLAGEDPRGRLSLEPPAKADR